MKFLICGLGSIGYRHLKILRRLGDHQLWAYRTGKSTIQKDVQEKNSPDKVFTDLDKALAAEPDAALVTNPTALHMDVTIPIVAKQIPVFIEKPLSHTDRGMEDLSGLVQKGKVPVLIGFNLIFHPAIIKIRQLIDANVIGEVISAEAHWGSYMPEWHPWENYKDTYAARSDLGGGVVLTMSHELNFLTDFFGKSKDCKAMKLKRRTLDISAEEGVAVLIEHETGIISQVHLNYIQKASQRTLNIIGSQGNLFWDFFAPEIVVTDGQERTVYSLGGTCESLLDISFEAQMKHFVRVVEGTESPRIPLEKGIDDLNLCLNILKEIDR